MTEQGAIERVQARIDNLLTMAERFDHPGGSRALARRGRDKAAGMETALRILSPSVVQVDAADVELVLTACHSFRPAFIREVDGNDWHRGVSVCTCGEQFTGTHRAHVAERIEEGLTSRRLTPSAEGRSS